MLALDHIVIVAPTLDAGAAHVQDRLGVTMPPGGEHPLMGTHNRLLRLGEAEFLEVIAVNPAAPAPSRPRWFALDRPVPRPRLAHWVVRCADMAGTEPDLPPDCGPAIPVTRGTLSWLLTVPGDGSLPWDGVFPSVIEWRSDPLPPTRMTGAGVTLTGLTLTHPQIDRIAARLAPLMDDPRLRFAAGPAGLRADLTIGGRRVTLD